MPVWRDEVTYHTDGPDADAATFNKPIQDLVDRTDYLKSELDAITNKSNTLTFNQAVEPDVVVGDMVYFDTTCESYQKAQAVWDDEYNADGELIVAASAYVRGIVVAKSTSTVADILLQGEYTSEDVVSRCLGTSPAQGLYYLSADTAGTATITVPPVKVPAITYVGGNTIIFDAPMLWQPNHFHKAYRLQESWLDESDTSFDDMEKPYNVVKGYDIASDTDFAELFTAYHGELAVFIDGALQDEAHIQITEDNIWTVSGEEESSSSIDDAGSVSSQSSSSSSGDDTWPNDAGYIYVYAYTPFVYGEPIVRAARTTTEDELEVTSENGVVTVDAKAWGSEIVEANGYAVASIAGKKQRKSLSVSSVSAGSGIQVATDAAGKAVVSSWERIEELRDAEIINLNNAVEVTDDPFVYYSFPENRASSIIGRCVIPTLNTDNTYEIGVWAVRRGITGATIGSPITYPAMTIDMTFVESPKGVSYQTMPTPPTGSSSISSVSSVETRIYYGEIDSTDRISVESEGTAYIKLSMASASNDKYILRFGVIIYNTGSEAAVPP